MINCVAVRFTLYDGNGVMMCSAICSCEDFDDVVRKGVENFKHVDYVNALNGELVVDEIQLIRDSVAQNSLYPGFFGLDFDSGETDKFGDLLKSGVDFSVLIKDYFPSVWLLGGDDHVESFDEAKKLDSDETK